MLTGELLDIRRLYNGLKTDHSIDAALTNNDVATSSIHLISPDGTPTSVVWGDTKKIQPATIPGFHVLLTHPPEALSIRHRLSFQQLIPERSAQVSNQDWTNAFRESPGESKTYWSKVLEQPELDEILRILSLDRYVLNAFAAMRHTAFMRQNEQLSDVQEHARLLISEGEYLAVIDTDTLDRYAIQSS